MKELILRCHKCRARNKIPMARISDNPVCGKCKTQIKTDGVLDGKVIKITDANFEEKVIFSPLPVLLDCWASWCGPCKMMAPVMDELAEEWKGRVRVAKLNVDDNKKTASRFKVSSIPTFFVFDSGNMEGRLIGGVSINEIRKIMRPFL